MATETPKIKLHWLNGSRAQAILWLLEELQVPYELELYHRQPSLLAPPELEKLHPLGKAPIVTIGDGQGPDGKPLVTLAESGFIIQYLCDHFGAGKSTLVPRRWRDGKEGQLGGETDEWLRYQYTLYYSEGSFMPYLWMNLIFSALQGPQVPFFVRPLTGLIAGQVRSKLIIPNWKKHFTFLERQLETSPNNGKYLAGDHLTAADVIMSFPIISGKSTFAAALGRDNYPRVFEYIDRLEKEPGWLRSADKIRELDGKFAVAPEL